MSRLKTSWVVMANVALITALLVFVALFSEHERKENYRHQVEHYVNTTVAMERVTENYMLGEQEVCDNWAQYINSQDLTLEEAAAFVRATHVREAISAHLIDAETLEGCSTRPKLNTEDDYQSHERRAVSGFLQPDHGAGCGNGGEEAGLSAARCADFRAGQEVGFPSGNL